jgi:hypothetical protein
VRAALAAACVLAPVIAAANGRAPLSNGVHFKPGDTQAVYVATTFGLLVSPDSCHFYWLCEQDLGIGGPFDPSYAVTATGAILATTYHGLRVSHDGGCSFTTATADMFLASVEVGPTGEIWIGSSDNTADNGLFVSTDDAQTFSPRGSLPASNWFRNIKVAPSDAQRIYVTSYQIPSSDPDAGQVPPSAHLYRSDNDGTTFTEMPLAGFQYGSVPQIAVKAVDLIDENIVYVVSQGANGVGGDRVYRSSDGGATFAEVLTTTYPTNDIVVRDATTVIVATEFDPSFRSTDRGASFQPLVGAPQLSCLGQRSDGVLFGCGVDSTPDFMALASSTDADHWHDALRFQYITGPLSCPAGTTERDTCDLQMWSTFATQFGITPAACSGGPDGVADAPPTESVPPRKRGCCDAGGEPSALLVALLVAMVVCRPKRSARRRRAVRRPARACRTPSRSCSRGG